LVLSGGRHRAPARLIVYEEIEFRFSVLCCSCKGQSVRQKAGCLLPASMLRNSLFFVRVNRFWCVWMRVPVWVGCVSNQVEAGPDFLRWVV